MTDLATAFGLVALAELGDKTQLLALALATRYRAWQVLVGITVAATVVLGAASLLGGAVGGALPHRWLAVGGGVLFLGFAAWTWREGSHDEDLDADRTVTARSVGSALVTVTVAFTVAELGDKTMLAAAALAATRGTVPVWLGAAAGMTAAAALGLVVGRLLGRRLPAGRLRQLSAVAFALFGVALLLEGVAG